VNNGVKIRKKYSVFLKISPFPPGFAKWCSVDPLPPTPGRISMWPLANLYTLHRKKLLCTSAFNTSTAHEEPAHFCKTERDLAFNTITAHDAFNRREQIFLGASREETDISR
jgi:hypothetical protein